jgi:hypothetical protein
LYYFIKYYYDDHTKENKWAGHLTYMRKMRNAYKIRVQNPEGKRQLPSLMDRQKDNTELDLEAIGSE